MGQMIEFGQRVQKIGIERFDCAQGVTVRAMLLNYTKPYARNLAFDEVNRCYVECDRAMAIKYGLNPKGHYYFLVAALQTDMNGNILGDKEAKITYMSMSENQYNHFTDICDNLDVWNGFVTLTKIKKSGDGRDFSYIEATPASSNANGFKNISPALSERLKELHNDEQMLATAIQLIDAATGLYEDKYIERINQNKNEQNKQNNNTQTQQTVSQAPTQQQLPPVPQSSGNAVNTSTTMQQQQQQPVVSDIQDVEPVQDLPF